MPFYPSSDEDGASEDFSVETFWEHVVAEYAGLSFEEIEDLPLETWLILRRDAMITKMRQTEKGREYLANAWRLQQTAPDRKKLRDRFGKGGL